MTHESVEKSYKKILSDYKLIQVDTPRQFNSLGQTWAMDNEIGNGFIWTYYFENLFAIKIHDIAYHKEALVEFDMPESLYIAYYTSISGEELNPYRRLNANCVKTNLNGYNKFKAIMHRNIPIRSVGIEIMPPYYEEYLQRMYPGVYASPYDAFLEVDETTDFPEMVHLLKQVEDYKETGMAGHLFYQAKVAEAIALVIERKKHAKEIHDIAISPVDMKSIMNVTAFISDHYAFELTIDMLAQIACMGETKLRKLFKQVHRCTIMDYIQNQRISQAEYLLGHTNHPIKQVAESVGYTHTSHFADLFRRTTGLLPVEYRKMSQKK